MTAAARILPGLPAYGPAAEPFPSSGYGAYPEDVVVEFEDKDGHKWVGNFQRGKDRSSNRFVLPAQTVGAG